MKIALLGYGKMGKTIERLAIERGHSISHKITENIENIDLSEANVAIDFSIPKAALTNIKTCIKNQLPVVSGTTGWLENYEQAVKLCEAENSTFFICFKF